MNPGDLRRFYESPWPLHGESFKAGKIFMIVQPELFGERVR